MLYLGSDHGGYKLKEVVKKYLAKSRIQFRDLGPKKYDAFDDYPDYASAVAKQVSKLAEKNRGILLCRSGQGMCIVANKFKHVRAAVVWNNLVAKASRQDDMSNVLCLPSDYISPEHALNIVKAWLDTPRSKEPKHLRRIAKITVLEKSLFR